MTAPAGTPGDPVRVPQLFSMAAVAELLGVHQDTVEKLVARGDLGHVRIGKRVLVRDDQVAAFIDVNTVNPDEPPAARLSPAPPGAVAS